MGQETPARLRGLETVRTGDGPVPVASTLRSRLLGLSLLERERAGRGLLIPGCRSVHTFGMKFRLDIHFIDAGGETIRIVRSAAPGRVFLERQARSVLELPARGGRIRGRDGLGRHAS